MKNSLLRVITKKYIRLLFSMLLVSSLGCCIMTGMANGFLSLRESLNEFIGDMQYPDVIIETKMTTKDTADRVREIEGVEAVDARLTGNLVLIDREGRYISVEAMTCDEKEFQKFYYWEKLDVKADYPILLEHAFCESKGIHAGDVLEVRLGKEARECTVCGVVSRAETIATPRIGQMKVSSTDICYMYIPMSVLENEKKGYAKAKEEWDEKDREYREAKDKAVSEHEKALKEITDAERELEEKEKELKKGIEDAEEQRKTLEQNRSELLQKMQELDELEKQLPSMKAELAEGESKLEQEKQKLASAKAEVSGKRRELDQAKNELDKKISELNSKLSEAQAEIDANSKKIAEWKEFIRRIRNNGLIRVISENITLPENSYELGSAIVSEIDVILSDTDYVISMLNKLKDKVGRFGANPILESMEWYASTMRALRTRMSDAIDRLAVPAVIRRIRDKVVSAGRLIMDKFIRGSRTASEVIDAAGAYIDELEGQIGEARKKLAEYSGYKTQLDEGAATIQKGYNELAVYEAEIRAGEEEIRRAEAELEANRKKISDGEVQITEGREKAGQYLTDIENGLAGIEKGISDGKQEFSDAERSLREAKDELDARWATAQEELSRGEEELRKSEEKLAILRDCDELCDQFLIRVSEGADPEAVRLKAEAALKDTGIRESFTYQTSSLKKKVDVNVDPIEIMTLYVPMIFFGVALIVVFLFMNLLVRRCRREIGIFRALGFSKGAVVLEFCKVSLVVSLGAILLGSLLGVAVTRFIGIYFRDFFDLYFMHYLFNWKWFLIAVTITVSVGLLATLLSMGYANRVAPAEAMTRPAPRNAFHSGRFLKNGNSFFKYCLFSLLRNKARFLFSVICLSASVMLIFMALSFGASKDRILTGYYEDRLRYDCEVFFSGDPTGEMMERLKETGYAREPEKVRYYKRVIRFGSASAETLIQAVPAGTDKIRIYDHSEKELHLGKEGLILEKHLADEIGVKAGDEVMIDGVSFPVTDISEQHEGRVQYISLEEAESLGEPDSYALLLYTDANKEVELVKALSEEDGYIFASFVDKNYEYWINAFKGFTASVIIVIAFAVIIGSVIVTNTLQANLLEQKKDLCILRTLGFQRSELSFRMFFQSMLYYIFACVAGIPAGVLVTKVVLKKLETDGRSYPIVNAPYIYLLTTGLVLGYVIFGHIVSMRSLKRWDIVESVKDKE